MAKKALTVSGVVFFLMALLHLSRLVFRFNVVFGDYPVPLWVNGIGLILAGGLSYWMFQARKSHLN